MPGRSFDAEDWACASGGGSWIFSRGVAMAAAAVLASTPAGAIVVDAGCGTGALARGLAGSGRRVVGIDHDPAMLAAASRIDARADFARGDLAALPLRDASASAVAAVSVLGTLADPAPFLAEVRRVLVPGGRLFVTITNRASLLLRVHHAFANRGAATVPAGTAAGLRAYTAGEATALLAGAGFRVEAVAHYNFVVETRTRLWPGRGLAERLDRSAGARGGAWARNALLTARAG